MDFRIGQEIVCVDRSPHRTTNYSLREFIYYSKVYKVSRVGVFECPHMKFNYVLVGSMQTMWDETSFRPLDEVLNEISIEEVFNNPIKEVV